MEMELFERWLRSVKGKSVRELQITQRRLAETNATTSSWSSNPCNNGRGMTCEMVVDCFNITSTITKSTYGIMGTLDCSSSNIIYVYQRMYCHKQYVGETGSELRVRNNTHRHCVSTRNHRHCVSTRNHRHSVSTRNHRHCVSTRNHRHSVSTRNHRHCVSTGNPSSALFTHLETHRQRSSHYPSRSVENYYFIIPIEQLPSIEGYAQGKLARLKRETFWIDTLGTLEPWGLNQKRCEDFTRPISNNEMVAFVVAFSRTANMASRIVKKHYEK